MQVRVGRVDKGGAFEEFPEQKEGEEDGDADVGGYEIVEIEIFVEGGEGVEAVEQDYDAEVDQGEIGGVGLPGRFEDQVVFARDVLRFQGGVEADVGQRHAYPIEERSDRREVLEPDEYLDGACAGRHVCQQAHGCGDEDAVQGYASEYASLALANKTWT